MLKCNLFPVAQMLSNFIIIGLMYELKAILIASRE